MSKPAKKTRYTWTDKQLDFIANCELMGREYYAAFRRRFKVAERVLSDQAIRARRVALYKANGWS